MQNLKIIKSFAVYEPGMTAVFSEMTAEHLIKHGIAVLVEETAPIDPNTLRKNGFATRQSKKGV